MIRNIGRDVSFGNDEIYQRLEEFSRHYRSRIRRIFWIILSNRCSCQWSFKHLASSFLSKIRRHYIAIIVLLLSVFTFSVSIVALRGEICIVIGFYCLSLFFCSLFSLVIKRGLIVLLLKKRSELRENQQLLEQSNYQDRQEADQPAGHDKYEQQALQSASENPMEPRKEADLEARNKYQMPSFPRSKSYSTSNYSAESFAGPSYAPDPFSPLNYSSDSSVGRTYTTRSSESYDYSQTSQRFSVAHISAQAIKAFGHPSHVFGADSYSVLLHSSDESSSSDEPVAEEVRKFEVSVEVHHSDSYCPGKLPILNPGTSGSTSTEPESEANDTVIIGS